MSIEGDLVKKQKFILKKILTKAGSKMLDLLYPPICVHCQIPIMVADNLCAKCFSQLHPITDPMCPVLGKPFAVSHGQYTKTIEAIAKPPEFDRSRSAFVYDDMVYSIISRLKYGDKPELAKFCAKMMSNICAEILADDPILLPVPLHKGRLLQRLYNQSNELAKHLATLKKLETAPMLVKRIRATRQQVGLSAKQRNENVAGAFKVEEYLANFYKEKRIVIVDDVITTGATVNAIAKALKKAGYKKIDVISFARVVKEVNCPI